MAKLKLDEVRQLLKRHFEGILNKKKSEYDGQELSLTAKAAINSSIEFNEETQIEQGWDELIWTQEQAELFRDKLGISKEDWDDSHDMIRIQARRAQRDMLKEFLSFVEQQKQFDFAAPSATTAFAPTQTEGASLRQALQQYLDEKAKANPNPKYNTGLQGFFSVLLEHFGPERLLASITKQDANEVKGILMKLPARRNVIPKLKGLSLKDALDVPEVEKISTTTINNHLMQYEGFFRWAVRHGHADTILFEGMKLKTSNAERIERKPFTPEQMKTIEGELIHNHSGLVTKESYKWGALIAAYTGARLNEICQLEISDIRQEDGIWYFDINDEGDKATGKRVKAEASKRRVPVHHRLLTLGFEEFHTSRQNHVRLFHDFNYAPQTGYGRALSRWFNDTFLVRLGIKSSSHVFHSFRHTARTRLAQADVPDPKINCLIGHATPGVANQVYFKEGFTIRQLKGKRPLRVPLRLLIVSELFKFPRHELIDAFDFVISDAGEDPCEPGLGIDFVELGSFDECEGDGHGFAAAF